MKSKTFSSNHIVKLLKQEIWMPMLMLLGNFIALPVMYFMSVEGWLSEGPKHIDDARLSFTEFVSVQNATLGLGILFAAACAVIGFSYLHSRKRTDFYYSQPVRRETLFLRQIVITFCSYALTYFISLAITLIVGGMKGLCTPEAVKLGLAMFAVRILEFAVVYFVAVIAMLLTGRIFVGVMGTAVLLVYPVVLDMLIKGFKQQYFTTYAPGHEGVSILNRFSPVYDFFYYRETWANAIESGKTDWGNILLVVLALITAAAALAAVSWFVIKKRPAEAAERSMAFKIPAVIIKFAIVIPAAMGIGLLTAQMIYGGHETAWMIAGVVFGAVFANGVMEVIYQMNFRKLFSHKRQLGIMGSLSILFVCIFCFDLTGYDKYLPARDSIENVSIVMAQNNMLYGSVYIDSKEMDESDYQIKYMKLKNDEDTYRILEKAVKNQRGQDDDDLDTSQISVCYRLNNGSVKYRDYQVRLSELRTDFKKLYGKEEYKEALWPVLGKMGDDIGEVMLNYLGEERQLYTARDAGREELLEVYKKELRGASGEELVDGKIIANFRINYGEGGKSQSYFPIYESFTDTIHYLKKNGAEIEQLLSPEYVSKIMIRDYRELDDSGEDEAIEKEYTKPEEIAEILPYVVPYESQNIWEPVIEEQDAEITIKKDKYQAVLYCAVLKH